MTVPAQVKIYHIVHVDRLLSIIEHGHLWCDAEIVRHALPGTIIGMNSIKERRLNKINLASYPDLHVGECVPFYFCPRSVMLYIISQANHPDLEYRGGQGPIVHMEADLRASVNWAQHNNRRWAFTLSNASSSYFEDRCNLSQLDQINWMAVQANNWSGSLMEGKQAEFLMEHHFPWHLIERIGVLSPGIYRQVVNALPADHRPKVEVIPEWYYL